MKVDNIRTCRVCGKQFDKEQADRFYGKEGYRSMLNICTPQCYNTHVIEKEKETLNIK